MAYIPAENPEPPLESIDKPMEEENIRVPKTENDLEEEKVSSGFPGGEPAAVINSKLEENHD